MYNTLYELNTLRLILYDPRQVYSSVIVGSLQTLPFLKPGSYFVQEEGEKIYAKSFLP